MKKKQKTIKSTYNEDLDDEEEDSATAIISNEPQSSLIKSPYKSPNQKKSLRTSTQLKSKATQKRTKIAEEKSKKRKRTTVNYRELTQEELLEEAKETEKVNKKSLERYEKLELEKSRKNKISRKQIKGPIIRYQSMTMPLISDLKQQDDKKKCSRNFITFTDESTFIDIFKLNEPKKTVPNKKQNAVCSVSKLPAR